jgi:orotidine-5'-phosphate decarboxylase
MIFFEMLGAAERRNNSMLCLGLDLEPAKFPDKFKGDGGRIPDFFTANVDSEANQ